MAKLPETENTFEITTSWLNAFESAIAAKDMSAVDRLLSQIAIGGTLWLSLGV